MTIEEEKDVSSLPHRGSGSPHTRNRRGEYEIRLEKLSTDVADKAIEESNKIADAKIKKRHDITKAKIKDDIDKSLSSGSNYHERQEAQRRIDKLRANPVGRVIFREALKEKGHDEGEYVKLYEESYRVGMEGDDGEAGPRTSLACREHAAGMLEKVYDIEKKEERDPNINIMVVFDRDYDRSTGNSEVPFAVIPEAEVSDE